MELVLIGLGGCSAYDVVDILEKGREAIESVVVELDADRADRSRKSSRASTCTTWLRDAGLSPRRSSAPSLCRSRNIARLRR